MNADGIAACAGAGNFLKEMFVARSSDFVFGLGFVFGNERCSEGYFCGGACSKISFIGCALAGTWMDIGFVDWFDGRPKGALALATIDGVRCTRLSNCSSGTNLVLSM